MSDVQQRRLDEDAAVAEIEVVIEAWYTFPFDSSKGEEGVGAQYLTGLLRQRTIDLAESDTEAGQVERERGGSRVEVLDVILDLDEAAAEALVCVQSDHELVNLETGEVIDFEDVVSPGEGTYYLTLTDEGWKLSEWFYSGQTEFKVCEFSP